MNEEKGAGCSNKRNTRGKNRGMESPKLFVARRSLYNRSIFSDFTAVMPERYGEVINLECQAAADFGESIVVGCRRSARQRSHGLPGFDLPDYASALVAELNVNTPPEYP